MEINLGNKLVIHSPESFKAIKRDDFPIKTIIYGARSRHEVVDARDDGTYDWDRRRRWLGDSPCSGEFVCIAMTIWHFFRYDIWNVYA